MPLEGSVLSQTIPRRPPARTEMNKVHDSPITRNETRRADVESRLKGDNGLSEISRLNRAKSIPSMQDIPNRSDIRPQGPPISRREMLESGENTPRPRRVQGSITLDDSDDRPVRRSVPPTRERQPMEDDAITIDRPRRRGPGVDIEKESDREPRARSPRESKEKIDIKNVKADDFQEALKITGKKVGKKVIDQVLDPVRLKDLLIAPIIVYKTFIRGLQGSLDERLEFKEIYQYCIYVIVGALAIGLITQRPRQCFEVCMGVVAFIILVHWITYDTRESSRKILEYLLIDIRNINLDELTAAFKKVSKLFAKKPKHEDEEEFDIERTGEETVKTRGFKNKFIEVTPINKVKENDSSAEIDEGIEDINPVVGMEVSEEPKIGDKINEALNSCGTPTDKVQLSKPTDRMFNKPIKEDTMDTKVELSKETDEEEIIKSTESPIGGSNIPISNPLRNPIPTVPPNIKPNTPQPFGGPTMQPNRVSMPTIPGGMPKPDKPEPKGNQFLVGQKAMSRQPTKIE